MSDWAAGYSHVQRWLTLAARLQGVIEAHRLLKGPDADGYDEMLYRMCAEFSAECDEAGR